MQIIVRFAFCIKISLQYTVSIKIIENAYMSFSMLQFVNKIHNRVNSDSWETSPEWQRKSAGDRSHGDEAPWRFALAPRGRCWRGGSAGDVEHPESACPRARVSSWIAAMVTDSVGDPKFLTSAPVMAAPRRYRAAATLCKNPGRKRYASRAGDDAEGSQDGPSWNKIWK